MPMPPATKQVARGLDEREVVARAASTERAVSTNRVARARTTTRRASARARAVRPAGYECEQRAAAAPGSTGGWRRFPSSRSDARARGGAGGASRRTGSTSVSATTSSATALRRLDDELASCSRTVVFVAGPVATSGGACFDSIHTGKPLMPFTKLLRTRTESHRSARVGDHARQQRLEDDPDLEARRGSARALSDLLAERHVVVRGNGAGLAGTGLRTWSRRGCPRQTT